MSLKLEFKPARQQDVIHIAKMSQQFAEDLQAPNIKSVPQFAAQIRSWLDDDFYCYLAWIDNHAIGYCIYREEEQFYYLQQLHVKRKQRQKGIATALLNWMYENHWTRKPVRLIVYPHNEVAIKFFKSYGFNLRLLEMTK